MRRTKITVNGQSYDSIDDVPEPMRSQLARMMEDNDGNGTPDLFESSDRHVVETVSERFVVDGKEYTSRDDLPPHVRRVLERQLPSQPRATAGGIVITPGAALILGAILLTAIAIVILMLR